MSQKKNVTLDLGIFSRFCGGGTFCFLGYKTQTQKDGIGKKYLVGLMAQRHGIGHILGRTHSGRDAFGMHLGRDK